MSKREELIELYDGLLFADGFDDAILGVARQGGKDYVVCYSLQKMVNVLSKDMDREDALEYLDYNVLGAYYGDDTPIYVEDLIYD